jgi:hypothetical protein
MKDSERNIMYDDSLRKCPYSVPEGYFESMKERAVKYSKPAPAPVFQFKRILTTAVSMAAMFVLMVTAGTFLLENTTPEEDLTQEDYIVFSDGYFGLEMYDDGGLSEQYADASISDEDIVEYLIYTGVSEELIELSK